MARCAVRAPSGRNVFRRLYRRGQRGAPSLPTMFVVSNPLGWRAAPSAPQAGAMSSGGFTAGDGAAHRPYQQCLSLAIGRDGALRRLSPRRAQHFPAALLPGTARRTVPTWFRSDARQRVPTKAKKEPLRRAAPVKTKTICPEGLRLFAASHEQRGQAQTTQRHRRGFRNGLEHRERRHGVDLVSSWWSCTLNQSGCERS